MISPTLRYILNETGRASRAKLLSNLYVKTHYVTHHHCLQFYLTQGLELVRRAVLSNGPAGPGPRAPKPQGAPNSLCIIFFSSREIIVTNCVFFHWLNKTHGLHTKLVSDLIVDKHLQETTLCFIRLCCLFIPGQQAGPMQFLSSPNYHY